MAADVRSRNHKETELKNRMSMLKGCLTRRSFVAHAGMACASAVTGTAWGQAWPNRPIKIVAAQQPGAANDVTARAFADYAAKALNTPVVVENKPGGLGMIAASAVASAPSDGYSLLMILSSQLAQASVLLKRPAVDGSKDLMPIAGFAVGAAPLCVHKDLPVRNIRELVSLARARTVAVGNYSTGSGWQIMLTHLAKQTGAQFTIVNYKGTGAMVQDLMSGAIEVGAGSLIGMNPAIQSKMARPIMLISDEPTKLLPGIPTWRQEGFVGPAFQDLVESNFLMGPARLPALIRDRLASTAIDSAARSEAFGSMFSTLGVDNDRVLTGSKLTAFVGRTWPAYQTLTRQLNLEPQ